MNEMLRISFVAQHMIVESVVVNATTTEIVNVIGTPDDRTTNSSILSVSNLFMLKILSKF
jgi:hypothetical protein